MTAIGARTARGRLMGVLLVGCLIATLSATAAAARTAAPRIEVLSNRADLVSGGDALVRVRLPRGVTASRLRLTADGRDVTRVLERTGKRRLGGVVTGLEEGRSALVASIRRGGAARLRVTNHALGGPIFAGPQIQPWTCQAQAEDAQCNEAPTFQYLYLPQGAPTEGAVLSRARAATGPGSARLPRTTRRTHPRPKASRRRPPPRESRSRSSSGSRPAISTATSTRSPPSSIRRSRGRPPVRSASTTTGW